MAAEIRSREMAKSKKKNKTSSKQSVTIQDLRPNKNPKGGASDITIKKLVDKSSP
jgi:hypothetical protein